MSNPDKRDLTYTLGDTPFGRVLEQVQSTPPVGDKKNGGRRHHRRPTRKDRPMPHTQTHDSDTTPVTPAGGTSKQSELMKKAGGVAVNMATATLKTIAITTVSCLTYVGLKTWGRLPLP